MIVNKSLFKTLILGTIEAPRASFSFSGDPVSFSGPSGLDANGVALPFPYGAKSGGGLRLTVTVNNLGTRFTDEERTEYNAGTNANETTLGGLREFKLSIRFESDSSGEAYELANKLRTRVRRQGFRATLAENNYALIRIGDVQDLTMVWDNREISAANVEMFLATMADDGPDPTNDGVWIETVDITGETTV